MIEALKVINIPVGSHYTVANGNIFILETCQRTILFGLGNNPALLGAIPKEYQTYQGEDAYSFLLEIICGLKSKMLGEHEIVGQFKTAYHAYLKSFQRNSHIILLLEKLFKDAKKIRSDYLMEIGQQSYAGLCRQLILKQSSKGQNQSVLIFGAGALARDLTKLLSKKFNLFLCARNAQDVLQLKGLYPHITIIPWISGALPRDATNIINTIGAHGVTLFNPEYFNRWCPGGPLPRLFVDLGSPSVVKTPLGQQEGVYRLEDLFTFRETLDRKKQHKIANAFSAIKQTALERNLNFSLDLPYGWEEMQFA